MDFTHKIALKWHHSLTILDSCKFTFTKSTISAKEGKLFVKIYTSSADLERDLAGLDVEVTCNGKTNETICRINIPTFKNANCELLLGSTQPYAEIIVPNGEKYMKCDMYVTAVQSPHCFEVKKSKITRKVEEEGHVPEDTSLSSEEPSTIPTLPTSTQGQITKEPSSSSKELVSSNETEQTLTTAPQACACPTATSTSNSPQQLTGHGQGNEQSPEPTTSSIGKITQTSKGNTENTAGKSCECNLFKRLTIFLSISCFLLLAGLIFVAYKYIILKTTQGRRKSQKV